MPAYETDQEQLEIFKKWWKGNGAWVMTAIILGLAVGLGWRYWQHQQVNTHQQASLLYQQLTIAGSESKWSDVAQITDEITQRYPRSEYAALANLIAAKSAVTQNNLSGAVQRLQWTVAHSRNASIQQIARIREARVLLAQNKATEAQQLLATINDKTFQPMIDEVQGDIYLVLGDRSKARQSYQAAQMGLSGTIGEDKLLSVKLAQVY